MKGDKAAASVFPLRKMFNTTSLLNYRTGLLTLTEATLLQARLDALISAFTNYKLPVVTLQDLTVEEVCPIFERINSSGTKLSTYDLMVAATWAINFDLNDHVTDILASLEAKGYGDTDRTTILKALSTVQLNSIQEKSLHTLRDLKTAEMESLTERTRDALLHAVDALSTQFGIRSWDFLSYEAILLILTHLFCDRKALNAGQVKRLRQWFWRASFGERYKVGGENFVSTDMKTVAEFVIDGKRDQVDFGTVPDPDEWGATQFRSNVARSRALILALAAAAPKNLTNGMAVDVEYALSKYNQKEYHHVYPRAYLKAIGHGSSSNVLANIVMLTSTANKFISDSPPSQYVPRLVQELGADANAVFVSNLLPPPSSFNYEKASYDDFLRARGEFLTNFIKGKLLV